MTVTFYYNNNKIQIFKIISDTINNVVKMHSHAKNAYEIHLIDSGKGVLETENAKYTIAKNSLYITGPNIPHKQIPDNESPMHELCIYLKISPSGKDSTINYFTQHPFWIGKSTSSIRSIFKQMIEESKSNRLWNESIISALAIRLIAEMARLYSPESTKAQRPYTDNDLNENRSWILDQLLLDDGINSTLNDFAKRMGVCPRQAERIIKEHYGSSFKQLRYESRMAMAVTLLEQKNMPIEECALICGYSSSSSFISAFRQKYKTTPKKYRDKISKN